MTLLTKSEIASSQLNMGLYDNETAVPGEVDAWDRAAARLLREKYVTPPVIQSSTLPNLSICNMDQSSLLFTCP